MKKSIAAMLLTSGLTACSGGGSKPPSSGPQYGQWTNFAINYYNIGNQFTLQQLLGYVYTKPSSPQLMIGQTITLNYSIDGYSSYAIHDPSDTPPASITLFIWQNEDDLSGTNKYASYRWWCRTRSQLVTGDNQILSCKIAEDTSWSNVQGLTADVIDQPANPNGPGFRNALASPMGVGFTFGGNNFFGHGATGTGNAYFKINQFTIGP